MALRSYAGGAKRTALSGDITPTSTNIVVGDGTGYPTGADGPFTIAIAIGNAAEEKVLIASRSGSTLTVATGGRGFDGTTAAEHRSGTSVDHVLTATDLREANAHVNDTTGDPHPQYIGAAEQAFDSARLGGKSAPLYLLTSDANAAYVARSLIDAKGDLLVGSADDTLIRLPVGAGNGRALLTDSAAPSGLTWGGSPLSQLHLPASSLHAAGGVPSFSTVLGYYGAWLLDSATTEAISAGLVDVPDEWPKVAADVYLVNPSASTGNYTIRLIFGNHAPGAALGAAGSAFFATAALGQNVLQKITLPDITVTPGNVTLVGIERAGADATDTLPNDIAVLHISLRRAA